MTGFGQRLEQLGVDDPVLLDWVAERGEHPRQAWDACARGDWRLWIAAASGIEPRVLVRAALACVRLVQRAAPGEDPRPKDAVASVERWLETGDGSDCASAADAAEAAGRSDSYREPASPAARHLAQAAAWLARAADAAQTAEVRSSMVRASAEAGRLTKWMRAQSFFDALLPAESGALEHALADDLAYAAAASVEAVLQAARALAEHERGLDDALARCDRAVAEQIPRRAVEEAFARS